MKKVTLFIFCFLICSCSSVNDENLPNSSNVIPQSPTNLIGIVNSTNVKLTWTDNSNNEIGFIIEKKRGGINGNFEVIGKVNANQINFDDPALDPSNSAQYRVKSFNDSGSSSEYTNVYLYEPQATNIIVGNQVWGIKNLDVVTYRDGTPIPEVSDPAQWANLTTGAWCYYNNDPVNNSNGKLYNWYAVAGIFDEASKTDITKRKQLAPVGTIPTNDEWWELRLALNSSNQNFRFINTVGYRNVNGTYEGMGSKGFFWTSTKLTNDASWSRYSLLNSPNSLLQDAVYNKMGLSVRYIEQKNISTDTYGLPEWTLIPDEKFEKSLIQQGIDDVFDGKVLTTKVSNLKLFRMEHTRVKDMSGIESFVSLEQLSLWDNDFTTINLRGLKKLKILGLSECPVSEIDLSQNTELIEIAFQHNTDRANDPTYQFGKTLGFTRLDLRNNVKLERVYALANRLTSLDVSMLPKITDLWVSFNPIETLDLSKNPMLNVIDVESCSLKSLNIKGTARNGVPRTCVTKSNPSLFEIKVNSVAAVNIWRATVGPSGIPYSDVWWAKDSHTNYVE